jgi:hypothetical protein
MYASSLTYVGSQCSEWVRRWYCSAGFMRGSLSRLAALAIYAVL